MLQPNLTRIPAEIIGPLSPYLLAQATVFASARVDRSNTGALFLIVSFGPGNTRDVMLVEISVERLAVIQSQSMNVLYPFEHPEKECYYLAQLDSENQITDLRLMHPEQRQFDWPYIVATDFNFYPATSPEAFNLRQYSKQKNKLVIEVIFEAEELKENMKFAAVRNFLLPFTELLKTAILSRNPKVNATNIEKKYKLGFSLIEHKCVRAIIESNYQQNQLVATDVAIRNITNMFRLLDADDKGELEQSIEGFDDKKIIPETIRILRTVIAAKGSVTTRFSTPDLDFKEIMLTTNRARRKKWMLESDIANKPYQRELIAHLTMLSFNSRRGPMFAIQLIDTDESIVGKICPELSYNLNEQSVTFNTTRYLCKLDVLYTPETTLTKEKTEYTLLDIVEAEPDSQTCLDDVD